MNITRRMLKNEKTRAQKDFRPVYRYGTDSYECAFCREASRSKDQIQKHMDIYHATEKE